MKRTHEYDISSFSTDGITYKVARWQDSSWSCTCPHFVTRAPLSCKHIEEAHRLYSQEKVLALNAGTNFLMVQIGAKELPKQVIEVVGQLESKGIVFETKLITIRGCRALLISGDGGYLSMAFDLETGEFMGLG